MFCLFVPRSLKPPKSSDKWRDGLNPSSECITALLSHVHSKSDMYLVFCFWTECISENLPKTSESTFLSYKQVKCKC